MSLSVELLLLCCVIFHLQLKVIFPLQQQISFKGRKLKLGPAIMKERSSRMYSDALQKNFIGCLVGSNKSCCFFIQLYHFFLHLGSMPSRLISPAPWMSPTQYFYCACCSPVGGGVAQPSPVLSGGNPYNQVTHTHVMTSYQKSHVKPSVWHQ